MKLNDMTPGNAYFVSNDNKWKESGEGRIAHYTGEHEGFNVEMNDARNGQTFWITLPRVRATWIDVAAEIGTIRDEKTRRAEVVARLHKMANIVMGNDEFGPRNIVEHDSEHVVIESTALASILNTARRAQKGK